MTLKQTYLSALPLDSLLRIEHQRALAFLCGGLSESFALLRGQVSVNAVTVPSTQNPNSIAIQQAMARRHEVRTSRPRTPGAWQSRESLAGS